MNVTPIATISKKVTGHEDLVVLPRREYERLKERDRLGPTFSGYETHMRNGKKYQIPVYQLHGKAAEQLDQEVREAMAEYKAGKTISAHSMSEAMKKYARRNKKN